MTIKIRTQAHFLWKLKKPNRDPNSVDFIPMDLWHTPPSLNEKCRRRLFLSLSLLFPSLVDGTQSECFSLRWCDIWSSILLKFLLIPKCESSNNHPNQFDDSNTSLCDFIANLTEIRCAAMHMIFSRIFAFQHNSLSLSLDWIQSWCLVFSCFWCRCCCKELAHFVCFY